MEMDTPHGRVSVEGQPVPIWCVYLVDRPSVLPTVIEGDDEHGWIFGPRRDYPRIEDAALAAAEWLSRDGTGESTDPIRDPIQGFALQMQMNLPSGPATARLQGYTEEGRQN
jgi:hypothetical protein